MRELQETMGDLEQGNERVFLNNFQVLGGAKFWGSLGVGWDMGREG